MQQAAVLRSTVWRHALITTLLTVAITPLYFLYIWRGELFLFWLSGGIRTERGWTTYGGIDFAWTTPLELPPTLAMKYLNYGPAVLAIPTIFIAVSWAIASLIVAYRTDKSFAWLRHRWKLLFILLGVVWIPVPVEWALVYYYTVRF